MQTLSCGRFNDFNLLMVIFCKFIIYFKKINILVIPHTCNLCINSFYTENLSIPKILCQILAIIIHKIQNYFYLPLLKLSIKINIQLQISSTEAYLYHYQYVSYVLVKYDFSKIFVAQ